jgi:hypothetical protein
MPEVESILLASKQEALSSNSSTIKKQKQKSGGRIKYQFELEFIFESVSQVF